MIKDYHHVCSRHFPDSDASKDPQLTLGKRFASPKKHWTDRAKRAKSREATAKGVCVSPSSNSEPAQSSSASAVSELYELPIDDSLQGGTSVVNADVSLVSTGLLA